MLLPTGEVVLAALESIGEGALVWLEHITQQDVALPRRQTNERWGDDQRGKCSEALE